MSGSKDLLEYKEIIHKIMVKVGAIKYCSCGECYWAKMEETAYKFVFAELKKQNIEIDNKFVQETVKQILSEGKLFDEECPYCNSRA